jgi:hypothetical protein
MIKTALDGRRLSRGVRAWRRRAEWRRRARRVFGVEGVVGRELKASSEASWSAEDARCDGEGGVISSAKICAAGPPAAGAPITKPRAGRNVVDLRRGKDEGALLIGLVGRANGSLGRRQGQIMITMFSRSTRVALPNPYPAVRVDGQVYSLCQKLRSKNPLLLLPPPHTYISQPIPMHKMSSQPHMPSSVGDRSDTHSCKTHYRYPYEVTWVTKDGNEDPLSKLEERRKGLLGTCEGREFTFGYECLIYLLDTQVECPEAETRE